MGSGKCAAIARRGEREAGEWATRERVMSDEKRCCERVCEEWRGCAAYMHGLASCDIEERKEMVVVVMVASKEKERCDSQRALDLPQHLITVIHALSPHTSLLLTTTITRVEGWLGSRTGQGQGQGQGRRRTTGRRDEVRVPALGNRIRGELRADRCTQSMADGSRAALFTLSHLPLSGLFGFFSSLKSKWNKPLGWKWHRSPAHPFSCRTTFQS